MSMKGLAKPLPPTNFHIPSKIFIICNIAISLSVLYKV